MILPSSVSTEEIKERIMKILSVDFFNSSLNKAEDVMRRSLKVYDNGQRDLQEMVWEKWRDADTQILNHYNEQISGLYERRKNSENTQNKFLQNMHSIKVGHLASEYIQSRQKTADDFSMQSQLAHLHDRRIKYSSPALRKAQRIIRNMFFISGMATSVLAVGHGKETAIKGCAAFCCLSIVAAFTVAAEERRVHHQIMCIKSNLMSWHNMSVQNKKNFYQKIMRPSNMGLCGFIETFKTRSF